MKFIAIRGVKTIHKIQFCFQLNVNLYSPTKMTRLTRNRSSKVCLFCRKRKKKCNREIPCRECLHADVKCEYQESKDPARNKRIKESQKNEHNLNETIIQKVYQKNKLSNRRLANNTKNENSVHSIPSFNI